MRVLYCAWDKLVHFDLSGNRQQQYTGLPTATAYRVFEIV